MKGQILICTAIMLNDHSNPYIESTTVLSDIARAIIFTLIIAHRPAGLRRPYFRVCACAVKYRRPLFVHMRIS